VSFPSLMMAERSPLADFVDDGLWSIWAGTTGASGCQTADGRYVFHVREL